LSYRDKPHDGASEVLEKPTDSSKYSISMSLPLARPEKVIGVESEAAFPLAALSL